MNRCLTEAEDLQEHINDLNIPGIEELQIDVNKSKPELNVTVDRVKAGQLGSFFGSRGPNSA